MLAGERDEHYRGGRTHRTMTLRTLVPRSSITVGAIIPPSTFSGAARRSSSVMTSVAPASKACGLLDGAHEGDDGRSCFWTILSPNCCAFVTALLLRPLTCQPLDQTGRR